MTFCFVNPIPEDSFHLENNLTNKLHSQLTLKDLEMLKFTRLRYF